MTLVVPAILGGLAIAVMALVSIASARRARRPAPSMGAAAVRILVHSINDDRCTGCDACVAVCPTNVLDLVENKSRLPIGSSVNVRVEGSSVMGIEGHIVRSRVSAIHRDGTLSYETAIEFERPQPIDGDEVAPPPARPAARGKAPSGDVDVYVIDTSNDW